MAGTCGYGEELSGSINAGNFLTSGKVYWLASQEGLCSMESMEHLLVSELYIHQNARCKDKKLKIKNCLLQTLSDRYKAI